MRLWTRHSPGSNVGDQVCGPIDYVRDFFGIPTDPGGSDVLVDIERVQADVVERTGASAIIVGGGGLLMPTTLDFLYAILCIRRVCPVIVWSIGSNYPFEYTGNEYPEWLGNAAAVGLRDVGTPYTLVPCVSCLHPAFQKRRLRTRRAVAYEHHEQPTLSHLGLPTLRNDDPGGIDRIADFLGSAEFVFTNTYHGAYWATLLGARTIIAGPWSTKFRRLPWRLPIVPEATDEVIRRAYEDAELHLDATEFCIERNRDFWREVEVYLK